MVSEPNTARPKPLSPQQKIIMQYLVDGHTLKEIALRMGIKEATIGKYIRRVRVKFGARSLYHCIALLVSQGDVLVSKIPPALDTP